MSTSQIEAAVAAESERDTEEFVQAARRKMNEAVAPSAPEGKAKEEIPEEIPINFDWTAPNGKRFVAQGLTYRVLDMQERMLVSATAARFRGGLPPDVFDQGARDLADYMAMIEIGIHGDKPAWLKDVQSIRHIEVIERLGAICDAHEAKFRYGPSKTG